eukprot:3979536-Pleurochrysis_carterae.AAC.1
MHRITNLNTLRDVIFMHLTFRERLRELYDPEIGIDRDLEEDDRAIYQVSNFVVFTAMRSTLDPSATYGDRQSYLFRELLSNTQDTPRDCCFWSAILEAVKTRIDCPYTIDEVVQMWGCGKKRVSLAEMPEIEKRMIVLHTPTRTRLLKRPRRILVAVHDLRLYTRRLPERPRDKNDVVAHIAVHNGHIYAFRGDQSKAGVITTNDLTFYGAFALENRKEQLRTGKIVDEEIPEDEAPGSFDDVTEFLDLPYPDEKCDLGMRDLYEISWELFRETQHLQPDMRQIRQYLAAKFNLEEADTVAVRKRVSDKQIVYIPRFRDIARKAKESARGKAAAAGSIAPIECKEKNVGSARFDMRSTICMDLETLSLRDCTFLPYSGRYRHEILGGPASVSNMARDVEDLKNGGVVK